MKKPWDTFQLQRLENLREDRNTYSFQDYSIYRSLESQHYLLGLGTGLGKSLCSLASYEYYKLIYPKTKLIVVTNNNAIFQFRGEYDNFFTSKINLIPIHAKMKGSYKKARYSAYSEMLTNEEVSGIIMNYTILTLDSEALVRLATEIQKKAGYKVFIIFDEASSFKNIKTKKYRTVKKLSKRADKVIALTATLIKGKLEEAYGIFSSIGLNIFKNKEEFTKKYCVMWTHPDHFYIKNITGYKNIEHFNETIAPYATIINKSEVSDVLPRFTSKITYVESSEEQNQLLHNIYEGRITLKNENIEEDIDEDDLIKKITEQGYLKRALLDVRMVTKENLKNTKLISPKTEEVLRELEEDFTNEKVVIYSSSKEYIKLLGKTIKATKSIDGFYKKMGYIHGDISSLEREEIKNKFQNTDEINLLLITDAGSEAINLQSAQVLLVMNLPKSAGDLIQLAGRLSRIGSKHQNLLINYILTEDSQDEDEYYITQQQLALMSNVMGEQEQGLVDWKLLIEKDKSKEKLSIEDFKAKNKIKMIFSKRKTRQDYYANKVGSNL